jgi:hypothetical protein
MPAAFLPEKLPNNPFAASEPSQSPESSIAWPSPPTGITDPALAAVLYQAQVDEFVKALHEPAATEPIGGTDTSTLVFVLFLMALGVTALGAAWSTLWGLPARLKATATRRSVEARLAELERLRAAGTLTDEEYAAKQAAIRSER